MNEVPNEKATNRVPDLAERPRAREDVVLRQADEEWVLFDPVNKKVHVLNVTSGLVWTLMDGENSLQSMVAMVSESFDPPPSPSQVEQDLLEITSTFIAAGLLL